MPYKISQKIHELKKYNKENIEGNSDSRQRVFELYCLSHGVDGLSIKQQEIVKEYYRQCIKCWGLDFFGECLISLEKVCHVEAVAICKSRFFKFESIEDWQNQSRSQNHLVTHLKEPTVFFRDSLAEDVIKEK